MGFDFYLVVIVWKIENASKSRVGMSSDNWDGVAQALIEEIVVLEDAFSTFFTGSFSVLIMIVKVFEGTFCMYANMKLGKWTALLTVYAH